MATGGTIPVKSDIFNTYANKVIPYMAIPANKKGKTGPWSDVVSEIVL